MNYKYQLVLQFLASDITDYDQMIALENSLIQECRGLGDVEGHDVGSAEMNIFIHTDQPVELTSHVVEHHHSDPLLMNMIAAFREFGLHDYTVVWPRDFHGVFEVK